jgi:hypothetical protein
MPELTASWLSNGVHGNAVAVGDLGNHARFVFADPPKSAADVVVLVKEMVLDLDGRGVPPRSIPGVPEGPTKEFHGDIVGGKFVATKLVSGKLTDRRNNEFRLTDSEGKNTIRAYIHDRERVSSHTLTLTTAHVLNGERMVFSGTAPLHVRFPLAMVIPGGTATFDTTLNTIPRYAAHWKSIHPSFRHVETTRMVVTSRIARLEPGHYDDVIRALVAAANAATAGVVALSVGHGSDGTTSTATLGATPFFNLVPEDNRFHETNTRFKLRIDKADLLGFDEPLQPGKTKVKPGHDIKVRLDALDRLADALAETPLRRLILHTCNAGRDGEFIQLLANRLRKPVAAQRDFIYFEAAASYYEKDGKAKLPRDGKFWPVHRLGEVKVPRKVPPPRFGPP